MAYSNPNVNAGNRTYNVKKLKETYLHLSVLKHSTINLGDVKVVLGQHYYHLHKATEKRKCGNAKPWAMRTKLGWMLSGPLSQQEPAKLATENLVAAEVDPLADLVVLLEHGMLPTASYPGSTKRMSEPFKCSRQHEI